MSETREVHRVLIVSNGDNFSVEPDVLGVARNDQVIFVVVGETGDFKIQPETNVYRSVSAGEEVDIEQGNSPVLTVRRDILPNTIHKYTVKSGSKGDIDPILGVTE